MPVLVLVRGWISALELNRVDLGNHVAIGITIPSKGRNHPLIQQVDLISNQLHEMPQPHIPLLRKSLPPNPVHLLPRRDPRRHIRPFRSPEPTTMLPTTSKRSLRNNPLLEIIKQISHIHLATIIHRLNRRIAPPSQRLLLLVPQLRRDRRRIDLRIREVEGELLIERLD